MAKKKTKESVSVKTVNWELADQYMTKEQVTTSLEKRYMPYAMSVIVSRALPDIDGFKPSQRKVLYEMYTMGLLKGPRTKSANIVGATMRLNPHGDASIYDCMVRMGRSNESLLVPYVDSKGNFGKAYSRDMASAASRYTEAKLEPICEELFGDIDKNTVDFVPNYDNTTTEPVMLPVAFPSILANNILGIAVGMACNICSFNLRELCETTAAIIRNESHDIRSTLPAPDFSGGGQILLDKSDIDKIYSTGKGNVRVRGKYNYVKADNVIEITEIPPTTTVEAIIEKIIELSKFGKLKEINDIRDETDLDGLKITIDLKRGTDPERLMAQIYKMTPMEESFSANFNLLIDNVPMVLGVKDILNEWIKYRTECVRRRTEFILANNAKRLHLLEGLEKILLDIDKAIRIIRETKADNEVVTNLMAGFDIDEAQAEYVADIKLRNLNAEYILKRTKDIKALKAEIKKLQSIAKSPKKIREVIASELDSIAEKYGKPRKTEILTAAPEAIDTENEAEQVEDYPVNVFVTKEGYIKKITPLSLRMSIKNGAGEHNVKDGDEVVQQIETSNAAEILFFTDKQNVYKGRLSTLAESKVSAMGSFIPSEFGFDGNEKVIYTVCTKDYGGYIVFFYENGNAVKIPLTEYQTKQNRKKLIKCYSEKEKLLGIFYAKDNKTEYALYVTGRKPITIAGEKIVEKTTKTSVGARVYTLKKKQKAISVSEIVREKVEQTSLLEPYL